MICPSCRSDITSLVVYVTFAHQKIVTKRNLLILPKINFFTQSLSNIWILYWFLVDASCFSIDNRTGEISATSSSQQNMLSSVAAFQIQVSLGHACLVCKSRFIKKNAVDQTTPPRHFRPLVGGGNGR